MWHWNIVGDVNKTPKRRRKAATSLVGLKIESNWQAEHFNRSNFPKILLTLSLSSGGRVRIWVVTCLGLNCRFDLRTGTVTASTSPYQPGDPLIKDKHRFSRVLYAS